MRRMRRGVVERTAKTPATPAQVLTAATQNANVPLVFVMLCWVWGCSSLAFG